MLMNKNESGTFLSNARELEPAGSLTQDKSYKFKFKDFDKQYETYEGKMVKLTYYLQVTIGKSYGFNTTAKKSFMVHEIDPPEGEKKIMNLEVGIEK